MINLAQPLLPLIRVIRPEVNTFALQELITEYLHEHSQPMFVDGQIAPAVPLTGELQQHVEALAKYLNQHRPLNHNFQIKRGYFALHDVLEHCWLQAEDVLVDIAIQRFADHPNLAAEIISDLANYSYLLCDNPRDPLYQLYIEDLD